MKQGIRLKLTLGLSIIFMVSGILLNILIRQVFASNLEKTIKSSMEDLMKSSRGMIINNVKLEEFTTNSEAFYKDVSNLISNSYLGYDYEYEIRNSEGTIKTSNMPSELSGLLEKGTKSAEKGKAVININYSSENATAVLSYPLYDGNKCFGILNLSSSYDTIYNDNNKILNIITLIEIIIFAFIFVASYIFSNRIINPILALTKQIEKLGKGDFKVDIENKNRDEIGILITEFIKMKDKIKEQIETINNEKDKVLKLEKVRREFFNNVTHELKTPLTAISGYSQMLIDKRSDDENFNNRAIERIYIESERLHNLVLDLIEVSKGVAFIEEDKKEVNMEKLINDICSDMQLKANKYSIHINKHLEQGKVFGQENKLKQLIINLIDNAIKYSFKEEPILVECKAEEGFYTLEITNKGNSINEYTYEHIFEPFVKGNDNVEPGSNGLGLYICSEIVKEHFGHIHMENKDEIKVIVRLPLLNPC